MTNDDRILPHDLQAEKATLGAILVQESGLAAAMESLQASDFFRRAHKAIFRAMVELDHRKSGIDLTTLCAELTRAGELDECGGPAYVAGLTDGVPRSANVKHYAEIVREHSRRRALISMANSLLESAYDAEQPVGEVVSRADQSLIRLSQGKESGRMSPLRTDIAAMYAQIEHRIAHKGELLGVDTGFQNINELTFGWQAGDMTLIAARPSVGKSAFVLNTALAGAQAGKRVAIFSLEMSREQLRYRLVANLAGVPLTRIVTGYMSESDLERVGTAMAQMQELHIEIDDRGGSTVGDIRAACRRLKSGDGVDLVVIDYVQLITGSIDRKGANRTEQMTDISRRLKVLADEVQAPLLVLSQLNRGSDTRADRRPILSDLRDSGALEQDADNVCFLHRKNHRASGPTAFIIEKQRNGPTGTVTLSFDREIQRFSVAPDAPEEPAEAPPPDEDHRPRKRR